MKVKFVSRESAKSFIDIPNHSLALLSINDDCEEMNEMCDLSVLDPTLGLYFLDTDDESGITEQDAIVIANFVNQVHKQKKDLIIHCYMGVSRSGAVAKWVNDHYGLEKPELENYTLYNKRVYSMLMNVTSGCIDIKNSMFGGE